MQLFALMDKIHSIFERVTSIYVSSIPAFIKCKRIIAYDFYGHVHQVWANLLTRKKLDKTNAQFN